MSEEELKRHLVLMSCFGQFELDEPCDLVKCAAKSKCKEITDKRTNSLNATMKELQK